MKQTDCSEEFVRYVESLRAKYKVKRNFMKLVERQRRSLYLG